MKLNFEEEYLSIKQMDETEISDFAVITGLNGSGKSQLLTAIQLGKVRINNFNKEEIKLLNSQTFNVPNDLKIDQKTLDLEYDLIMEAFTNKRKSIESLTSSIEKKLDLSRICKLNKKSYTDLSRKHFSNDEDYNEYIEFVRKYKLATSDLRATKQNSNNTSITINFGLSLRALAEKLEHSILDLSDVEIRKRLSPFELSNTLLAQQFGKIFWDYYIKIDDNNYQKYLKENNLPYLFTPLTDEEFIINYGRKPWEVLNEIFSKFEIFNYSVNSPEGLSKHEAYEYKLISKTDSNLLINHQSLSSGEKVIMALISLMFRMKIDNKLPKAILFDEVDSNLHPSMIRVFLEVINETIINNGSKVIMVTHSPTTVSLADEQNIYLMNKFGAPRLSKVDKNSALNALTEGYITLDQGLKVFEKTNSDIISIISEGKNNIYLKKALELFEIKNVNVICDIESITGCNQLKTMYDFFSSINHNNVIIFVWDCDVKLNVRTSPPIYSYFLPYNEDNKIATKGIENMFPESLFSEDYCLTVTRPNYPKKVSFDPNSKKEFEKMIISRSNQSDFLKFEDLIQNIKQILKTSP